jgi:hypothetical protein
MNIFKQWLQTRRLRKADEEARKRAISWVIRDNLEARLIRYTVINLPPDESALDREQRKIDAITKWAKSLPWGPVRQEYLEMLEYYFQFHLNYARREFRALKRKRNTGDDPFVAVIKYRTVADGMIPKPPRDL